jgi:hypothetical protein
MRTLQLEDSKSVNSIRKFGYDIIIVSLWLSFRIDNKG